MAKKKIKISGFGKVRKNLQKALQKMEKGSMEGMLNAAIDIRRDMEVTPPIIPVDLGNLRASWFTNSFRTFKGPGVIMGFNANYAAAIHEKVDADFKRPGSGAKFFEKALKRNKKNILLTIGKNSKPV